ncbi:TraR/DksA family transcriptional regulator [Streptomyces sp. NRRL F-2799]|uniref:TraR/DksA family transcriptional regulator n=1 Tax=Streptomyces sp. NRRL F-2799 TaxID=1463844 RepID=UPI00099CBADD|nr:TraR/DksA family transcriptional regulator [Streptomyces sp. NRRL F-2799]
MVAKKTSGGSAGKGSGRPEKADKAAGKGAAEKRAAGEKRAPASKKTIRAKKASAGRAAGEKTGGETVTPGKTAAKATAAEAATPQGTTAGRTTAEKTAAKRSATKKTAAKKSAAKTSAAKTSATKTPAQKLAAKKTAGKKAVAKKTATKKTAAQKAPGKSTAEKTGATRVVAKKTPGTATADGGALPGARVAAAEPGDLAVRPGEDPWTPEEVAEARAELAAEADRLGSEISSSEATLVGMMRDSADGAGDDEADTGSKNITREHELALAANAREMLSQTERALERLDAGTYGLCENCGNPIGKARMQAFPRATLCVECKQKQERRS